jgi:glyoxylase-like metal-dependent hydrolase (beta-lactamase superfamily II)
VWVLQSQTYATNSGVIFDGTDAILIDPGLTPDDLEHLREFLRRRKVRVRFTVLTHGHWDHLLGADIFPRSDVIAQQAYLAERREHFHDVKRQVAHWRAEMDITAGADFAPPRPTVTFDRRMSLYLENRKLILIHAPGHSPDQCAIYIPDVGLLWAGDMLSDREPPMAMGGIPCYLRTLKHLRVLPLRVLVPGHGMPTRDRRTIHRRFEQDLAYLESLQRCVIGQVQQDASLQDVLSACRNVKFVQPDNYPNAHVWNIESAYAAFVGWDGDGPIGWEKDWL